mgnify:CR=1 FL=1
MTDATQNGTPLSVIPGYVASKPGIQIGTKLAAEATDEDIQFVKQLGIEWVMSDIRDPQRHTVEDYIALRERFEGYGLKIYRLANNRCHNMPEVTLNLPGRDEKIAEYLQYIRNLGAAGIHYSTYAHMGNGIWHSGREMIRGGAESRAFHIDDPNKVGFWGGEQFREPLSHGRVYTEDELWENYVTFIQQVVPVAEEAGVFIGIHPDDPPVYDLAGVPRCIFGSFDGYKRAIEIADSPNIGMCMCAGCWLEGGALMGKDVVETLRYFAERKKLFKVHFRNVTAPMPEGFAETYMDAGYYDMFRIVQVLQEVGFDGAIMSDHLPKMVGGARAAEAYGVAYMKALVNAARSCREGE